jgi:hypothetical protein
LLIHFLLCDQYYFFYFFEFQYNGHLGDKDSTIAGLDHLVKLYSALLFLVKLFGALLFLVKLSGILLLLVVRLQPVKTS